MSLKRGSSALIVGLSRHMPEIEGYTGLCTVCGGDVTDHILPISKASRLT